MFIFLFICSLLVPLSMTLLGHRWSQKPPEDINGISGYRTAMAKLNQDTWIWAHKYWGKINFKLGILLMIGTAVFMISIRNRPDFELLVTALVFIQIAVMALTAIPTEIKLNKVFTKTGQRK